MNTIKNKTKRQYKDLYIEAIKLKERTEELNPLDKLVESKFVCFQFAKKALVSVSAYQKNKKAELERIKKMNEEKNKLIETNLRKEHDRVIREKSAKYDNLSSAIGITFVNIQDDMKDNENK